MKFKSKKPKPPTGMEMTVTLCMPDDQTVEQSSEHLIKFFEFVTLASKNLGSSWLKIHCSNIPEALEGVLQTAFDQSKPTPKLTLIVNNNPAIRSLHPDEGAT